MTNAAVEPTVQSRKTLAAGRFLQLEDIVWSDSQGVQRHWENAARTGSATDAPSGGAALMICWLEPSDRLLLVRQFRPPAGGMVVEFPAGLIDPGEDAAGAALRELREETGYTGQILRVWPAAYNTPGLSSEKTFTIIVRIDERQPENQNATPDLQAGEEIQVLLKPRHELLAFVEQEMARGGQFDSKVVAYLAALFPEDRR